MASLPKFRAWHKELKKMDSVCELIWRESNLVLITCDNIGFGYPATEVELMQWTGLQDCRDKDLYDADILKGVGIDTAFIKWCKNDAQFQHCGFDGENWHETFITQDKINKYDLVIVGNIYENSDLLQGQK